MKKFLLSFLFLCMGMFVMAQNVTTTISGTVVNTTTGLPVNNQAVYISADSSSSSFNYYNVVYTNPNGYYIDTLSIPSPSQIIFYISTSDCNGSMITNYVVSSTLPMTSNFTISCGGNPSNCSADFSAYPDTANTLGYTYYFYDQSIGGAGSITTWYWDFGDGGTSTLQYPTYTYANVGLYTICLSIATDSGCTATFCDSIYVDSTNTQPCYASFQYIVNNTSVDFYGWANNSTAFYNWDFGDGYTGTGQNPIHVYTSLGSYTVCLTVYNSNGCYDTYCETITVGASNGCPASFYAYPDSSGSPYTYYFYNYSPGANNGGIDFSWSFGDGTGSTDVNPIHTFPNIGVYDVCLYVYDSLQNILCSYCDSLLVDSSNTTACQAYFYAYPDSSNSGNTYYFADYSSGSPTNWYWDFGDGASSSLQYPSHTYSSPGTYTVCLSIWDAICQSTYCDVVTVTQYDSTGCYAFFGWNATSTGSVYFNDYSTTNGSNNIITSWTWSFDDGTSSTDQNPIHTFGSGLFNVCLAITTSSGCSSTYCDYVQVNYFDSSNYCGLYVLANSITNESAPGAADGAIDIDVYGGVPPYIFSWSNGATTEDISGLTAGYYDVVVSDNSGIQGCQTWATFEVLDLTDSSNWNSVYIDTLYTGIIDSCFNFSPGMAYIYSYSFVNNTTIEVTWIVYDSQGTYIGYVTVTYTFASSGNYQFAVTIICGSTKSTHIFYDNLYIMGSPAGLTDINPATDNLILYPNPVTDKLNVQVSLPSDMVTVKIISAMGQTISTSNMTTDFSQNGFSINTSSLSKGMYFIQVNSNGQTFTGRFIK
jgi:PKD repeat protein